MMERWLPLALFGIGMAVVMAVLSRYQARKYQDYLANHTAVSDKMRENQERLIEQQERTIAAAERHAAALDRIATALEKRS